MNQQLQQFIGEPVDIIYLDQDDKSFQQTIHILSVSDQCVVAYIIGKNEPKLFKNENILAVMPIIKYLH